MQSKQAPGIHRSRRRSIGTASDLRANDPPRPFDVHCQHFMSSECADEGLPVDQSCLCS